MKYSMGAQKFDLQSDGKDLEGIFMLDGAHEKAVRAKRWL